MHDTTEDKCRGGGEEIKSLRPRLVQKVAESVDPLIHYGRQMLRYGGILGGALSAVARGLSRK